jgi:SpoVK/Ycf46/Vps4 family AAA+-type ATPase
MTRCLLYISASYLKTITSCLSRRQVFPFPLKNPLYNLSGTHGRVLSLRLCLVGIVTCPDDGWRMGEGNTTILDSMIGGRYRLPSLTGSTRLTALQASLQDEGIDLTNGAQDKLPILAASAAWAKGSAFQRIARQLRELLEIKYGAKGMIASMATLEDLSQSIAAVGKGASSTATEVSFQAQESDPQDSGGLFESVGGNTEAKRSLEDALALDPVKRQILARFGLSPPTGILLYGPPGCGKTLLAKAVAKLLNVSQSSLGGAFISLRSSDIVRAEVGTSEKMVASAFELARKNAPSVIFIDEFQALFTERSSGGSAKLASTLLQCMDDVKRWRDVSSSAGSIGENHGKSAESNRVVVLGATNTPWMVDSAFLRPGRFDRVVHVGLPTRVEREAILRVHMGRMKIRDKGHTAALPVLCSNIAEHTGGFSGADLAALCRSAAIRCLLGSGEDCEIEDRHFLEALKNDVKASCSEDLVQRLLKWRP